MYLFIAVETDGVGSFLSQTVVRVALTVTSSDFEVLSLESFFVQGASTLQLPHYTLEKVGNGLRRSDAKHFIESRLFWVRSQKGTVIAHNLDYVLTMLSQLQVYLPKGVGAECTMNLGRRVCGLLPVVNGQYKFPKLSELHETCCGTADVGVTAEEKAFAVSQCYKKIKSL